MNPLSRQVLVPLSKPSVPPAIHVPGPGPPLPKDRSVSPLPPSSKPAPPVPQATPSHEDLMDASESGDVNEGDDDHEENSLASPPPAASDPYANLDNAFGGYMADEPKPQTDDQLNRLF